MFYCSCRHAAFATYFGDALPKCVKGCDACESSRAVEKKVAGYRASIVRRSNYHTNAVKITAADYSDQYEGGRHGRKM